MRYVYHRDRADLDATAARMRAEWAAIVEGARKGGFARWAKARNA